MAIILVGGMLTAALGCGGKSEADAPQKQEAQTVETVRPTFTPELAATPEPTSTPKPEPTPTPAPASKIQDEWYVQRNEDLRKWMGLYGEFPSQEAMEETIARMDIDPDKPMVALTFDDGPMEGITDQIVDILAEYDARATFFIRGARMKFNVTESLLKKILGHGNELGNHLWKHELMTSTNTKTLMNSISRTNDEVFALTGYTMHSLRPPGGQSSESVERLCKRYDLAVILWAQSGNVHEHDPAKIAENVQRQIVNGKELEDGDIILLHDTKEWMVEAVRIMVPQLIEKGYQLVTVQELLHLSPRGYVYGETYKKQ